MDAFARRQMWNLLRQLHSRGITILLTTHYIDEAQTLCDRVALINQGKLETVDTPSALILELGEYAVDEPDQDTLKTRYFPDREEAISYLRQAGEEASMRATTLEDVFISRVGRGLASQRSRNR